MLVVPASAALAQSPQPPPKSIPQPNQQQPPIERGTAESPVVVRVLPSPPTEAEAAQQKADRNDQTQANRLNIWFTGAIAFFTGCLLIVTLLQWRTLEAEHATTHAIERAYVDISHGPDGMAMGDGIDTTVRISVKNHGRTPADVTMVFLQLVINDVGEELPDVPNYGTIPPERTRAFLMPGEAFSYTQNFGRLPFQFADIASGDHKVWLIGYVDYMDRFKGRHRGGYARRYVPLRPNANNLVWELKPSYNYDRARKKGEGNDWDQS